MRRTIAHTQVDSLLDNLDQPGFFMYDRPSEEWVSATKGEAHTRMCHISMGLWSLGVRHGDRVAVMSESRFEWALADMGGLTIGAAIVSIYPTSTAEATGYILNHSGAKVVFLENQTHWAKVSAQLEQLPNLEQIILFDAQGMPSGTDGWITLATLEEMGQALQAEQPELVQQGLDQVQPDDLASLMYTSGTTGLPKGVALTHEMLFTVIEVVKAAREQGEADESVPDEEVANSVIYLPMSHILQRVSLYGVILGGGAMYFAPTINDLVMTCRAANPASITGVPRVYEKIRARIMAGVGQKSEQEREVFAEGLRVGRQVILQEEAGLPVEPELRQTYDRFDQMLFKPLRRSIFGTNIEFASCGAAPISRDLLEFFYIIGVPILEGYGLTETCAPITLNLPNHHKIGTVGPALPGSEIKIAPDGEVLLKGPSVFQHYYNNPNATSDAFTPDGWFKSGDIGHLDEDGFLTITDRKKFLIITAAGKNIPPAPIEMKLIQHPLVSQVVVHGDRRRYLTALFTLDEEGSNTWAKQHGMDGLSQESLAQEPALLDELGRFVDEVNENLARYETIKRFQVLPEEFSVANGFLTSSMKVKRKVIEEEYADLIDSMYIEG